jgi:hypothetical protein
MRQYYSKIEMPRPTSPMEEQYVHSIEVHFQAENIFQAASMMKDFAVVMGHDENNITKLVEIAPKEGETAKPRAGEPSSGSWLR